jgi:hypothetical protein
MTILSTNNNPKNQSIFARRRSITKGHSQQLQSLIQRLRDERRTIWIEVQGNFFDLRLALKANGFSKGQCFGSEQSLRRVPQGLGNKWVTKQSFPPPARWMQTLAPDLKSDLQLIWPDLNAIALERHEESNVGKTWDEYVFVVAIKRDAIDIVFSKYGFRPNHHFYHWQAVSDWLEPNGVHVDDSPTHFFLSGEELGENPLEGVNLLQ